MIRRRSMLLVLAVSTLLAFPAAARAGDAFLKVGLTLSDVGGFTDRWFVSAGTDWGFNDTGYLGLELQGAYRSNAVVGPALVDAIPANVFLNGKWKAPTSDLRPFAGLGFGMMSAYVTSEVGGNSHSEFVKDGGFQVMGGLELQEKWVFELMGQRVFADGASFAWSLLAGLRW